MPSSTPHQRYLPGIVACTTLFTFRVVAQLLQRFHPVGFLPPFASWQSGALPYSWLVGSQLVILFILSLTVWGFVRKTTRPRARLGKWLTIGGWVYFSGMAIRLLLGLTIASANPWFGAIIPAIFHLALAMLLLQVGHFHMKYCHAS